jgi:hypothetical protein
MIHAPRSDMLRTRIMMVMVMVMMPLARLGTGRRMRPHGRRCGGGAVARLDCGPGRVAGVALRIPNHDHDSLADVRVANMDGNGVRVSLRDRDAPQLVAIIKQRRDSKRSVSTTGPRDDVRRARVQRRRSVNTNLLRLSEAREKRAQAEHREK